MYRPHKRMLTALLLLALAPALAIAQPGAPTGWSTELGIGAIVNPEFQGGKSYQFRPIPFFDVRYRDERGVRFFANVPQGLGGYLYRSGSDPRQRAAVSLAIAPGFATRDSNDIPGLAAVNIATEARLSFELDRGDWSARATVAADLGTGHEGAWIDLSLQRRGRLGSRGFWAFGPTLRIVDGDYANAQYGVSAAESLASGLPAWDAGSGAEQISLGGIVRMPISGKWSWTTVASIGHIVGNRADSPVVEQEIQGFMLFAVTRSF